MKKLSRAWIPNSLTMGNLIFGFLSLIYSAKSGGDTGQYAIAGLCIIFAALFDGMDGQVARMLKVSSKIGAELDSLADCVTFGVAPGFLAYSAYLSELNPVIMGKVVPLGIFIAVLFPICAAYRLARFNVSHEPGVFSGLPSPVAGIIMALVPMSGVDSLLIKEYIYIFAPVFAIVAILMVSTIKFSKPQTKILQKLHGVKLILFILILIILAFFVRKYIVLVLIGLSLLYIISGLISFVIQFIQDRRY